MPSLDVSLQQACSWAQQACTLLVHGQIEDLVEAIEQLPKIAPPEGSSRSVPEKAMDYFSTNAPRMRYPSFRAQGMHVGSGIAEAAWKTMVETRAKRTGMRWTPEGLDACLALACCQAQSHLRRVLGAPISPGGLTPTTISYTPLKGAIMPDGSIHP